MCIDLSFFSELFSKIATGLVEHASAHGLDMHACLSSYVSYIIVCAFFARCALMI